MPKLVCAYTNGTFYLFALNEIANKYLSYMEGEWNCWLLYKHIRKRTLYLWYTQEYSWHAWYYNSDGVSIQCINNKRYKFKFCRVPSSVDPLTFAGTTNDWTLNGSWARLNPSVTDVPATATVDFAMLVWQGTLSATVTETVVNNNIPTLQTPDGVTHTITSVSAWGETRSSGTFQGTIYTRAANVTSILQGISNRATGDYFVERIPTANPPAQGTGVGWALVVVYRDNSYPVRNVSLYTGLLISTLGETATISNFITPSVAPVNARVFTMAINGDTDATGDNFNLNGTGLSGPNNVINNFLLHR